VSEQTPVSRLTDRQLSTVTGSLGEGNALVGDCLFEVRNGRNVLVDDRLTLGIDVGQTSVAKYMARHRRPPSQEWKTFLCNHADGIASMDLFVVPTLSFRLLYGLLILCHGRRHKC
jgi:hypothetical protein